MLAVAGKSADYVRFARRLREAREEAGLAQAQAARLGRGQSYVSKSESGGASRRRDRVEGVREALRRAAVLLHGLNAVRRERPCRAPRRA